MELRFALSFSFLPPMNILACFTVRSKTQKQNSVSSYLTCLRVSAPQAVSAQSTGSKIRLSVKSAKKRQLQNLLNAWLCDRGAWAKCA